MGVLDKLKERFARKQAARVLGGIVEQAKKTKELKDAAEIQKRRDKMLKSIAACMEYTTIDDDNGRVLTMVDVEQMDNEQLIAVFEGCIEELKRQV